MGSVSANPERRHQRGWPSAWIAAARLMAWGYRILGQRVRTLDGTIDLVAVRALRLSLIEVKRRTTRLDAVAAPGSAISRRAAYRDHQRGFGRRPARSAAL